MRIPLALPLHPLSSWQRALAAIRRERGNLVPSAAALCLVPGERWRLIVRRIMNAILLVAGLFGAGLLGAAPTAAQTYDPRHPVCIEIYTIDGRSIDCSFATIAQCAATASGQSAQCYANPYATQSRQLSPVP